MINIFSIKRKGMMLLLVPVNEDLFARLIHSELGSHLRIIHSAPLEKRHPRYAYTVGVPRMYRKTLSRLLHEWEIDHRYVDAETFKNSRTRTLLSGG